MKGRAWNAYLVLGVVKGQTNRKMATVKLMLFETENLCEQGNLGKNSRYC